MFGFGLFVAECDAKAKGNNMMAVGICFGYALSSFG
jgi:hypothetical protein